MGITPESGDNSYLLYMFLGEYQHNLDSKGRVAVPAKFRGNFKSGAIVSRGLDHCLFVFEKKEWSVFIKKIKSLSMYKSNSRAFNRMIFTGATEVDLDAQGRVLLADYLREYAGLKKQVVVAGLYNRLEIWDEESWKKYKKKTEASFEDISEQLGELDI